MNTKSFLFGMILLGLGVVGFGFSLRESYADNTPSEGLIARGTVPFWRVEISRDEIIFLSPTAEEQKYPYIEPMSASSRPASLIQVYRLQGNPSGFLVLRQDDTCNDGMADYTYSYNATLILGNQVFEGCAEKQ
ncbi:hypothetical protein M595_3927 [Lyngbya aestuarii BL J]|uniref:Uncharacterized protein n=1 Tax=Lyngbya aestuarii BL J TaxID=1348334 RepID=U7QE03_9CYAN|nr:hypothetical protein [Lyngbya aestuarii]ERT06093.1 hypothetical protein M595_3927 [Lyngbya aestuarii BL J]